MAALDLRPLSLGELLDRTFSLYRRNFWLFLGILAIPYLVFFLGIVGFGVLTALGVAARSSVGQRGQIGASGIATMVIGIVAAVVLFLASYVVSHAATIAAVSEMYSGRPVTIRGSFGLLRGKVLRLCGIAILCLLILIPAALVLIVPAIYLACRLCIAFAPALIEDVHPADSIRRSFTLTQGFAGRGFMIYLLAVALAVGVAVVLKIPFFMLTLLTASHPQLAVPIGLLFQAGNLLGTAVIAPVSAIAFALHYYDLRVRKEAFDLQVMMRAVGEDPSSAPVSGGVPSMFGRDAT
jgi:hypothetical protein